MPSSFSKSSKLAVYSASGLGDAVLAMQLAYQLSQQEHQVTLYSTVLGPMARWFPSVAIKPFPPEEALEQEMAQYDHFIAADYTPICTHFNPSDKLSILYHHGFDKKRTMLSNLLTYAHQAWGTSLAPLPAFTAPAALQQRREVGRVILHPTSGADRRNWPGEKFVKLGKRLQKDGYKPVITVTSKEAADWQWVTQHGLPLEVFSTLDATAAFYYESGYFVGNDSGGGHLASLLNVPTLTLCARASYLRLWRPGWAPGVVVTPLIPLPGAGLKQKYWKSLLTVGHAARAFHKLSAGISYTTRC